MTVPDPRLNADYTRRELDAIERRTKEIGRDLFSHLDVDQPSILQRRWWDDQIMAWAMKDERLKVELFRFVDVLPMLRTNDEVIERLIEYLDDVKQSLPAPLRVALGVARRTPFTRAAVARAARLSAMDFARRFIAGTNTREVLDAARRERSAGRGFTLDILGEAVTSDSEADRYFRDYADLIEQIAPTVNGWPAAPAIDVSPQGPIPRVNLSIKLSALDSHFDAIDADTVTRRVGDRLAELLRVAGRHGALVNVDMESYEKKELTLRIFRDVLDRREFRDLANVGIVIQCYLRDAADDLVQLRDWARQRGAPVWVRLVKGAYWDHETIAARSLGWPTPVFQKKWQSDANFEQATRFVMAHSRHLRPALGTHNLRSIAHGMATAAQRELAPGTFELQMLYGMADAEKQTLVARGNRLRIYMPYGELIPGMAYLVRRLLENTSNESFLRAGFVEHVAAETLLRNPLDHTHNLAEPKELAEETGADEFTNQPSVDFSVAENRRLMREAIDSVRGKLGRHAPLVIDGQSVTTRERIVSRDPSRSERVVGECSVADGNHVQAAVAAARAALPTWWGRGARGRAELLRSVAAAMRQDFFELAAWQLFECGKGWREATNDVCEAIDFCEYYATGAIALEEAPGVDFPGEENRWEYLPRGVTAVIAPWNFPLAILTGMTAAALATGNTVIMKPAEQSPLVASLLMEIVADLDVPPGVLQFLPGNGEVAGAALVEHPDVALIAFTGSRQVGLAIHRRAAELSAQGGSHIKRVLAEMGGKNAIIVDSDADLDEAVVGVLKSAFGYQGQKCSACSRAIVLAPVHDAFVERLVAAARSLAIGPAEDPSFQLGPVIDDEARDRILRYIELGRQEGRLVFAGDVGDRAGEGCYLGPHIFTDVAPAARIAQEEIFGPVLAVLRASDFDDALRIANGTEYALTGGVYSRSPAHLHRARREFLVGNLYLNRSTTGALVGRQPFGGFKMSGIGSKAGGPDYLRQFMLPRTVTENTIRRGFAPPT